MNGKRPSSGAPTCWKTGGSGRRPNAAGTRAGTGTARSSAIVRGSRRSCHSTRRAVAKVTRGSRRRLDQPRNASSSSLLARCARSSSGVAVASSAVAQQQQLVAPVGLVHHVARDEQRRPAVGELVEQLPELAPQHRVEPDRRLVEDEQLGPAEQRRRERDARPLAARQPADDPVAVLRERDVSIARSTDVRRTRRGRARSSGGSRARSGRRRPTAPASRSRRASAAPASPPAARAPSTVRRRRSARRRSHASASTCRSRSARAARSPMPRGTSKLSVRQHLDAAADDAQPLDADRRLAHWGSQVQSRNESPASSACSVACVDGPMGSASASSRVNQPTSCVSS